MKQFYANEGWKYDVARGDISGAFSGAQFGFDLERDKLTTDMIKRGIAAGGTALSTLAAQPKSSQEAIDQAFEG